VATSQLESAIQLWFYYGDPVSIHTLAAAASDCFSALSAFDGHISFNHEWLKALSRTERDFTLEPQNFFKHGHRNPKQKLHFVPHYAELLMYDCCICFERMRRRMRPLMEVFMLRFVIENPIHLKDDLPLDRLVASRGFKLSDVAPLCRPEISSTSISQD